MDTIGIGDISIRSNVHMSKLKKLNITKKSIYIVIILLPLSATKLVIKVPKSK